MTEKNTDVIDKVLNDDMEDDLKAYRFFTDDQEFLWTPPAFRKSNLPRSKWPIFKLRGRDGIQLAKSEDELGYTSKNNLLYTASGSQRIETLRTHIIGWKNVFDRDGKEITYMSGNNGVSEKLIGKMPSKLQVEIYQAINDQSRMTDEELQGLEF